MKILVVKTSSMGDVIHTLPAVTDALAAVPGLVVDWAVEPGFADLVRLHPGVSKVWPVPVRAWRRRLVARETFREIGALRAALRAEAYDLVIDAQGLVKSLIVARLPGRPVHGLDRASAREPIAAIGYANGHAVPRDLHAIDRTRLLFGAVLGYKPDLARFATGLEPGMAAAPDGAAPTVFLLHGTTWPTKRWPLGQWIELAGALVAVGWRPRVTYADADEEAFARAIVAAVAEVELVPRTRISELARLIAESAFVVGVDTGLTHLAAALGRPTVALFASTAPGLTAPRGADARVLAATTSCAPCRKRLCPLVADGEVPPCHATIGPDRVMAEIGAGS